MNNFDLHASELNGRPFTIHFDFPNQDFQYLKLYREKVIYVSLYMIGAVLVNQLSLKAVDIIGDYEVFEKEVIFPEFDFENSELDFELPKSSI